MPSKHITQRYGLTHDEHAEMLRRQCGLCAICERPFTGKKDGVDHDHITGVVRGLLCNGCNVGIGMLKDSPLLLQRASAYLERHDGQSRPASS